MCLRCRSLKALKQLREPVPVGLAILLLVAPGLAIGSLDRWFSSIQPDPSSPRYVGNANSILRYRIRIV